MRLPRKGQRFIVDPQGVAVDLHTANMELTVNLGGRIRTAVWKIEPADMQRDPQQFADLYLLPAICALQNCFADA